MPYYTSSINAIFDWLRVRNDLDWANNLWFNCLIISYDDNKKEEMEQDLLGRRNSLFHNLNGITKDELFDAWQIMPQNDYQWNKVVCKCLNLISGENFQSLEEASLMAQVHQELEKQIALLSIS